MEHCFSIDIEEWFDGLTEGQDQGYERRLDKQVHTLLEILETYRTQATFFWLGSRAREYPALLRTVASLGHEIACHGFHHRPVYQIEPAQFRSETSDATLLIQDIIGQKIDGFRAPYFSITARSLWALEMLAELEYTYDSSIYPARHWRYGIPNYPSDIRSVSTPSGNIFEVPLAVRKVAGYPIPLTGGAYFRLYPYAFTQSNISSFDIRGKSIVFNIHPWELDADHPRIKSSLRERLPHYYALTSTIPKLHKLFSDFSFIPIGKMLKAQRSLQ